MQSDLNRVCQQSKYSDLYRNYFTLNSTNQIIVEVISPIAAICSVANLIFFYKFPNARQPPFDILLLITIFSIVNISVYVTTLIYNSVHTPGLDRPIPDDFTNFCQVTGTMRFGAQFGITIYNTVFCFYYTCKIRNPLRTWVKESKEVHVLCLILTIIGIIIIYLCNQIGVSVLGVCGLKVAKSSVFIQLAMFIIYFIILIITSIFFLKYLKRISQFDLKARLFFKYFLIYTMVIALIYFLQSISMILLIVDCFIGLAQNIQMIFSTIGNFLVLVTPVATTIIIGFHPQFGKKIIKQIVKSIKKSRNQNQNRNSLMIEMTQMSEQMRDGYLSTIKQSNRVSLLTTILGCISLTASQRKFNTKLFDRKTMVSSQEEHIFSWNYNDLNQIQVDQDIVEEQTDYFTDQVQHTRIKFISHSMSIFQQLMNQDNVDYLQQSTNPHKNLEKVYKNAQADGGSSGQFFFFTFNNRILLKSITKDELNVLLNRLQSYYNYLKYHPESFIVKIYGVFSVVQIDTHEQIHFMMMGNLCEDINRKYMLRIYDCKGSSHKRQVFKESKEQQQPEYSKKTMKDVDFDRLEHKVWIREQDSKKIRQILKQDSLFFYENGLIDYSLIIIKIDYNAYVLDLDGKKQTFNSRTMFRNEKEPNMIYILGIIDYLQTWNVKKKGERWYKSIFTRSDTISSQSPAYYSQRFIKNLVDKIFAE